MADNWQTIFSTNKLYQAEMAKNILYDNEIEAILFNQQDSLYLFGDIEIKVMADNVIKAKFLIKDI